MGARLIEGQSDEHNGGRSNDDGASGLVGQLGWPSNLEVYTLPTEFRLSSVRFNQESWVDSAEKSCSNLLLGEGAGDTSLIGERLENLLCGKTAFGREHQLRLEAAQDFLGHAETHVNFQGGAPVEEGINERAFLR